MKEQTVAAKHPTTPRGDRAAQKPRRYTMAEKLKAVRLYQEEGFSLSLVCQEMHISKSSLEHRLQAYRLWPARLGLSRFRAGTGCCWRSSWCFMWY